MELKIWQDEDGTFRTYENSTDTTREDLTGVELIHYLSGLIVANPTKKSGPVVVDDGVVASIPTTKGTTIEIVEPTREEREGRPPASRKQRTPRVGKIVTGNSDDED